MRFTESKQRELGFVEGAIVEVYGYGHFRGEGGHMNGWKGRVTSSPPIKNNPDRMSFKMRTRGEISVEVQWIEVKKELNLTTFVHDVQITDIPPYSDETNKSIGYRDSRSGGTRFMDVGHLNILAPSADAYITQIKQTTIGGVATASSSNSASVSGSSSSSSNSASNIASSASSSNTAQHNINNNTQQPQQEQQQEQVGVRSGIIGYRQNFTPGNPTDTPTFRPSVLLARYGSGSGLNHDGTSGGDDPMQVD